MSDTKNYLIFGAHPDDCDFRFGATAMKLRELGHNVKFVSMTNGDTGHFSMGGGPLARRRYSEAQAAAKIADVEYQILDIHNGELQVNVRNRWWVIELMRDFDADVVVCHRANDYHPDHRAVGHLVQDASYTVTVPNVAPLTPALQEMPVLLYAYDRFHDPTPFVADIAVDTDDVFERKVDMIHCHESQVYEWLPYSRGELDEVPEDDAQRRELLREQVLERFRRQADDARECLAKWYGEQHARNVETAEAFMISEYGRRPSEDELAQLFPFVR